MTVFNQVDMVQEDRVNPSQITFRFRDEMFYKSVEPRLFKYCEL